jgi:hypothetical protein
MSGKPAAILVPVFGPALQLNPRSLLPEIPKLLAEFRSNVYDIITASLAHSLNPLCAVTGSLIPSPPNVYDLITARPAHPPPSSIGLLSPSSSAPSPANSNQIAEPGPAPPPASIHLIIELRSSRETWGQDGGETPRAVPPGRRGERLTTWAAHLAILRYVEDFRIDNRLTARELTRRATGYAFHLGLKGADLLDPENSTFREIARDSLAALRVPDKSGWKPD